MLHHMIWFSKKKTSDNELGEYLPDEEAQLQEGSEPIQAKSRDEAQKKGKEVASQYDSVNQKRSQQNATTSTTVDLSFGARRKSDEFNSVFSMEL